MLCPRTENLGLGTAGEGRGVNVVVSRKVALWVDMVGKMVFVLIYNMYRSGMVVNVQG